MAQEPQRKEWVGLALGALSVLAFWVPPVGLFLGIAGVAVTASRLKQKMAYSRIALALSVLGILLFVGFWTMVWVLSQ
jgi:uncharacterized membrane protein YqaE (UPF0057 family)